MNVRRLTLPSLAAAGLVVAAPGLASAHVTVTPDTTAAGSYAVLTFSNGHGCEGSPTTKIAIAMPPEVAAVTPTINPGWRVEKVVEKLDAPVKDAHGNELTERVGQVVYTAKTPLADGYRDTFELSLQLPEDEGTTLTFPVVQTCEQGSTSWTETPAAGQDAHELDQPAPAFTLSAADGSGHGHDEEKPEDAAADETEAGSDDSDSSTGLAIGGLVAGLLGLALGAVALLRTRGTRA